MSKAKNMSVSKDTSSKKFQELQAEYDEILQSIEATYSEDSHDLPLLQRLVSTISYFRGAFEILDNMFGLCELSKECVHRLEKTAPVPLEKLCSLELELMNASHNEDNAEVVSELILLLKSTLKTTQRLEFFRVMFSTPAILKLHNFLLIIIKAFPRNQVLSSNAINIIVLLIKKGYDAPDSVMEILLSLIHDVVHEKGSSCDFQVLYELITKFIGALALKGIQPDRSNSEKDSQIKLNFDILVDNKAAVSKNINTVLDFLFEKVHNSKSTGYRRFWKFFCDASFINFTLITNPMSSTIALHFIEKFIEKATSQDEGLSYRVAYFELLTQFTRKHFELFYNLFLRIQASLEKLKGKIEMNLDELVAPRDCSVCSRVETDRLCSKCYDLVSKLEVPTKMKLKTIQNASNDFFNYSLTFAKYLKLNDLYVDLFQKAPSYISDKIHLLNLVICNFEYDGDFPVLNDVSVLDQISLSTLESTISNDIDSQSYNEIYQLTLFPKFAKIMDSLKELCLVLSNDNSTSLRLKVLAFINDVCKIAPNTIYHVDSFKKVLDNRIYDSAHTVRLVALEVLEQYHRGSLDYNDEIFQVILERSNDVAMNIRKNVIKFLLETLLSLESSEENNKIRNKLYLAISRKIYDNEEVSSLAKTACLMVLFKSFQPNEKAVKKTLSKNHLNKLLSRKNTSLLHEHFERNLQMLKYCFEQIGDEWYKTVIDESKKFGVFHSEEILEFITYVMRKLHNQENEDHLFYLSVLRPFSKTFAAEFIPELNYFYLYFCQFNESTDATDLQKLRPYLRKLCEIIQNIVSNYTEKLSSGNVRKFANIEKELFQLIYKENLSILTASLKTVCLLVKSVTNNYIALKDLFCKCINLLDMYTAKDPRLGGDTSSVIRASYIVSYVLKHLGVDELFEKANHSLQRPVEDDITNELYDTLLSFVHQEEKLELRKAGIECISCLWEKKPLLSLKSRDVIQRFVQSDNSELKYQIFRIFHNILVEYRENNQIFYQKLQENFKERVKGKKNQQIPSTSTLQNKPTQDMSSVIQLISECVSHVVPHLYDFSYELKMVVLRVILSLIKEGHCHIHTVFKRVFALVSDDNEEIRNICIDIIQQAVSKNATIIAFELENAIIETYNFQEQRNQSSLFIENLESEKIPAYEVIYEYFINYAKEKELTIRNPIDAACTALVTMGNNPRIVKFLCEFVGVLPRVTAEDYKKWTLSLQNFIERKYQKVMMTLKPLVKGEINDIEEIIEKNQGMIFSLFNALVYLNYYMRIARDFASDRVIASHYYDDTITLTIDNIRRKVFEQGNLSNVRLGCQFHTIDSINVGLNNYLEVSTYQNNQNIVNLYKTIKSLYQGNSASLDIFEGMGIEIQNSANDKKSVSKKKKVSIMKETKTPKKKSYKAKTRVQTSAKKRPSKKPWECEEEELYVNPTAELNEAEWKGRLRRRRYTCFRDPVNEDDY